MPCRNYSYFAALLLGLMFFSDWLPGQNQQSGKIIGEIRISRGDFPPHQILVELRLRGAAIDSAYADSQGRFGFSSLAANPYHVVIDDADYFPVDELANVNPLTAPYAMVQITLRPRDEKKKVDPMGKRTTGSNPYLIDPGEYNRRFPKKAIRDFEKGVQAEHKGKLDDAMLYYQNALKIAPDYYPAHNNLGSIYLSKTDLKSAEEQFQQAVHLDQGEAQSYFNLGNVLMLTGRYSESQAALELGLQRRPDSAFGHFLQGCLYKRTGRLEDAEKSLQDAMALDSSMTQVYLQLVNLYIQEERKNDAIAQLQTFLKAFPAAPTAAKARDVLRRLQDSSANAHVQP